VDVFNVSQLFIKVYL